MSHARTEQVFFWLLTGAATLLFAWTVQSFMMPIFSAVVVAILFHPYYARILKTIGNRPSLASAIVIAHIIVLVALPLYGFGTVLTREAITVYESTTIDPSAFLTETLARTPQLVTFVQNLGISQSDLNVRLASFAQTSSTWALGFAASLTTQTIQFVLQFIIAMYLAFFLLKDGEGITHAVSAALPIAHGRRDALFARFVSTVRAVVKGSILVSLVQGILGGLLFFIVGIPNPVLWGSIMAFLALLPFGGPTLVWLPAAAILFFQGNTGAALVLVLGGGVVIGLIDNILRPILVGRDIKMPDPLVLISVLGGLVAFGPGGIIIGPVIAALFLSVWEMVAQDLTRGAADERA